MKQLMIVDVGRKRMYFDASTKHQIRKACLKVLKSRAGSSDFSVFRPPDVQLKYYGKPLREIKAMPRGQEKKECLEYYNKHRAYVKSYKSDVAFAEAAKKAARYGSLKEAERIVLAKYGPVFEPVEEV